MSVSRGDTAAGVPTAVRAGPVGVHKDQTILVAAKQKGWWVYIASGNIGTRNADETQKPVGSSRVCEGCGQRKLVDLNRRAGPPSGGPVCSIRSEARRKVVLPGSGPTNLHYRNLSGKTVRFVLEILSEIELDLEFAARPPIAFKFA